MIGKRVLNSQLILDGKYQVYSANVNNPFGKMNTSVLKDFKNSSVLWGIDGDWMVNYLKPNIPFNPTDHCGVLRVISSEFNSHFVKFCLEKEGKKLGFSRSYRASLDRISTISIPRVPKETQDNIINEIEMLESKIKELEKNLPILLEKQKEIVMRDISSNLN